MSTHSRKTLLLFSALARALSHKIRTPLSIISNDLFSLRSLVEDEALDRSLEKTEKISKILNELSTLTKNTRSEPEDLFSLLKHAFRCEDHRSLPQPLSIPSPCGTSCIQALTCLLQDLGCANTSQCFITLVALPEPSITLVIPLAHTPESLEWGAEFSCLTEVVNVTLGIDSLHAPILDAIFDTLEVSTTITYKGSLQVTLFFPHHPQP